MMMVVVMLMMMMKEELYFCRWKVTERWADSHAVKTKEGYSTCLRLVFSKRPFRDVKFETNHSLDCTLFLGYACIHNLPVIR